MSIELIYCIIGLLFGVIYCFGLLDENKQRDQYNKSRPTNLDIIRNIIIKKNNK